MIDAIDAIDAINSDGSKFILEPSWSLLERPWAPHQAGVSLGALAGLGGLARASKGLPNLLMTGSGLGPEGCKPEPKAHTYSRPGLGQAYYTRAGYGRAWAFEPGPAEH